MDVTEKISYGLLFVSVLPGKIVGLEMFGVLQLAFITLANVDQVNLLLSPLMKMKGLNGYNADL